ncbi:hypothetical protein [Burkholderia gladioli]|uniref:hypothetical protein n=1 Tax=Burkholderia gladioli TaxID=28095 RepID=UPI003D196E63
MGRDIRDAHSTRALDTERPRAEVAMANAFTENWDPKRGDIINGVDEDRTKYRGRMPASSNGSSFLMDQFNNNLLPGAKQFGKTGYPKNPDVAPLSSATPQAPIKWSGE